MPIPYVINQEKVIAFHETLWGHRKLVANALLLFLSILHRTLMSLPSSPTSEPKAMLSTLQTTGLSTVRNATKCDSRQSRIWFPVLVLIQPCFKTGAKHLPNPPSYHVLPSSTNTSFQKFLVAFLICSRRCHIRESTCCGPTFCPFSRRSQPWSTLAYFFWRTRALGWAGRASLSNLNVINTWISETESRFHIKSDANVNELIEIMRTMKKLIQDVGLETLGVDS